MPTIDVVAWNDEDIRIAEATIMNGNVVIELIFEDRFTHTAEEFRTLSRWASEVDKQINKSDEDGS